MINAGVSFPFDATGLRRILLARANTSTNTPVLVGTNRALHEMTVPASGISSTYTQSLQFTTLVTVTSAYPTIYLRAYQNSGSAMSVSGAIQYIRIA